MGKWFWLFMSILALLVGCGVGRPAYREDAPDYWKRILYHQTSAAEPVMQKGADRPDQQIEEDKHYLGNRNQAS